MDGFYLHGMPELQQGRAGERLPFPPLLEALALDPLLSGVKMFAADAQPCEVRGGCWSSGARLLPAPRARRAICLFLMV